MEVVVCEGLSKQYPGQPQPALDRVSLGVEEGQFLVLLGPSGSGKTTLIKLINRLYEPTAGRVLVHGVDVRAGSPIALRRQIGYVIQQVGLFPHMTVAGNIAVVPRLLGWEPGQIRTRVVELLELVGLPPSYLPRRPRQLSGGEQQRVGLARALAADPDILLMDEPFGALDSITRLRLQGELRALHQKLHKTILFVTHDVDEAFSLADQIAILNGGKLIQVGTPLEVITSPQNKFVDELIGAGDMVRRLSLVTVRSFLASRPQDWLPKRTLRPTDGQAILSCDDDLRKALSLLLLSGQEAITILGAGGNLVGEITFADLRAAIRSSSEHQSPGF